MSRTPKDVTDAELAVLEALWARGEQTVRELADELYPGGGGGSEYATVQKLCERLEGKDFVRYDRATRPHRLAPAIGRDDLIGRQLRRVADTLCSGSFTPLINQLVEQGDLSSDELDELRARVDQLAAAGRRRRRRKGGST